MLRVFTGTQIPSETLDKQVNSKGHLVYEVGPVAASDLIELNGEEDWRWEFVDSLNDDANLLYNLGYDLMGADNGEVFIRVTAYNPEEFLNRGR